MRSYPGVDPSRMSSKKDRDIIAVIDTFLRDASRGLSPSQPAVTSTSGGIPAASYITTANEPALSAERRLVVNSPLSGTDGGANGTYTLGLSASALVSLIAGTPANTYGTTFDAGVASTLVRTDARLKFPTAIMSAANSSTLTLTDDATDQTLTGSLGALNLRSASDSLSLPKWTGGGENAATVGSVLSFVANSNSIGSDLRIGIDAAISYGDNSTYTSATFRGMRSQVITSSTNSPTYTNVTCIGYDQTTSNISLSANTHTFTKRTGIFVHPSFVVQSGTGVVTVTDYFGIEMATWPAVGTIGTVTNARAAQFRLPTIGGTVRRGVELATATSNLGTEAANVEGFYCEDIARGTALRRSYAAEGATTGTPTDVVLFDQVTAHAVGTNRYFARGLNAMTLSNPSGIAQTVLSLSQLNTGATAGAHLNFQDKAGDPPAPVTGDLWRNGDSLWFRQAAASVDLTAGGGSPGADGPMGPIGLTGEDGMDGDIGPMGPAGAAGAAGTTGAQGPMGPAVFLAAESLEGEMGPPGVAGAAGATGSQGIQGIQGPLGPAIFLMAEPGEDGMIGPPGATGPQGPAGGGGGGNVGTAVVDFGAFPGQSDASIAVTGQASILSGSVVNAWIQLAASADHSADEHMIESVRVLAGNIVAGTGFTIYALNDSQINEPLGWANPDRVEINSTTLGQNTDMAIGNPWRGGQGTRLYGTFNCQWQWS